MCPLYKLCDHWEEERAGCRKKCEASLSVFFTKHTLTAGLLCYDSARLRLLVSESVFELALSRRDRHSFGIARLIFSWKGLYLYIINPLQATLIKLAHIYGLKLYGQYSHLHLVNMRDISSIALYQVIDDPGMGRGYLRKSVVQSACQYDVMLRVSDFQNGE